MILNNYYNAAANMANIVPIFSESRRTDIGVMIPTSPKPSSVYVTTGWSTSFPSVLPTMVQNWNPRANLSVIIGNGTTEPTPEDVELANDITSSIANYVYNIQTSADGASIKTVATITGANTSGSDITITEIGIQKAFETAGSGTSPQPRNILMIRHMLDTPKVVPNGQSFSLTFEWVES